MDVSRGNFDGLFTWGGHFQSDLLLLLKKRYLLKHFFSSYFFHKIIRTIEEYDSRKLFAQVFSFKRLLRWMKLNNQTNNWFDYNRWSFLQLKHALLDLEATKKTFENVWHTEKKCEEP
jgi:hypothetical protein